MFRWTPFNYKTELLLTKILYMKSSSRLKSFPCINLKVLFDHYQIIKPTAPQAAKRIALASKEIKYLARYGSGVHRSKLLARGCTIMWNFYTCLFEHTHIYI